MNLAKLTDPQYEPKGNLKDPVYVVISGNTTIRHAQAWVNKNNTIQILFANLFRHGFEIYNNGNAKIYVGHTSDPTTLKQVGRPIMPNTGFPSSSYQGDIYAVADDSAVGDMDVRIWEESLGG